jgi:hypothetical protein
VIATAKILKADRVDGRDDGVRGRANYRHSAGPQMDDAWLPSFVTATPSGFA